MISTISENIIDENTFDEFRKARPKFKCICSYEK